MEEVEKTRQVEPRLMAVEVVEMLHEVLVVQVLQILVEVRLLLVILPTKQRSKEYDNLSQCCIRFTLNHYCIIYNFTHSFSLFHY